MVFAFLGKTATDSWTRLSEGLLSPSDSVQEFSPPFREEYPSGSRSFLGRLRLWWRHHVLGVQEPQPASGYLTLIPLNGMAAQFRPSQSLTCLTALCCPRTMVAC